MQCNGFGVSFDSQYSIVFENVGISRNGQNGLNAKMEFDRELENLALADQKHGIQPAKIQCKKY